MMIYQHHVLATLPRDAARVAGLAAKADATARAAGGRVFAAFTPMIGLSNNHAVLLSEFPDEATARACDLLAGIPCGIERHEFWEPAPRPAAGETIPEIEGVFSHRWFDCADGDWPRLQELSVSAWDNFEGVHDTRVIGFWRSRTPPAAGLTRVWLMAWYRNLGAWEGSRWFLGNKGEEAAQAYERFRARSLLTVDSAVSLLRRVV